MICYFWKIFYELFVTLLLFLIFLLFYFFFIFSVKDLITNYMLKKLYINKFNIDINNKLYIDGTDL
jgi:hypothetical protein